MYEIQAVKDVLGVECSVIGTKIQVVVNGKWVDLTADEQILVDARIVEITEQQPLLDAIEAKTLQIKSDYDTAEALPVVVNGVSYVGGYESATRVKDYIKVVTDEGGTVYNVWDIYGTEQGLSLTDANLVALAIGQSTRDNNFIKKNRKIALYLHDVITPDFTDADVTIIAYIIDNIVQSSDTNLFYKCIADSVIGDLLTDVLLFKPYSLTTAELIARVENV